MGIVGALAELKRSGLMIPIMVIGGKNMALLEEFSALEILVGRFALAFGGIVIIAGVAIANWRKK